MFFVFFLSAVQSGSNRGLNLVSTINSAETPANGQTQCESNCVLFDPVINEVAALHLTGTSTRFTGHVEQDLTLYLSFSIILWLFATHNSHSHLHGYLLLTWLRDFYLECYHTHMFFCPFCIILHTVYLKKAWVGNNPEINYILFHISLTFFLFTESSPTFFRQRWDTPEQVWWEI